MERAIPEVTDAAPFPTMAAAQRVHLDLGERARLAEEKYGNAGAKPDEAAADELDELSNTIRDFELRLSATGARLPDGNERSFAQSLLDFWAVRRTDLQALRSKFVLSEKAARASSAPASGCLLAEYDEGTAREAADKAEQVFAALPDDGARETARAAFIALTAHGEQPSPDAAETLAPFVAADVLSRAGDTDGTIYALGHGGLLQEWSRLREWLAQAKQEEADLERLKASAEIWARSGSASELPRGELIEKAARYSTNDETLESFVAAARRRSKIEQALRILVLAIIGGLLGLVLWSYFTRLPADLVAGARDAVVTKEIADREEIVDVPRQASGDDTASSSGLAGWIWVGSADDPKIVGENGETLSLDSIRRGARLQTVSNLKVRQDKPDSSGTNIAGKRQAGVSAGTLAVALEDSVPIDVKGTAQYWLKVRLIPVVYIQYDRASRRELGPLRDALERAGFNVPPEEGLPNIARQAPAPAFDVRFYFGQDEPAARRVAQTVSRFLGVREAPAPTSLVGSPLADRVKTGTIEVWLYQP